MVVILILFLFQSFYINGYQYQKKIEDISLLKWWIAITQIEYGVRNETYLKCQKKGKFAGIYFKDQKGRTMVYRFYKNQLIQSRYMNHRFYGYVPYLFSIKEGNFYEKNQRLYIESTFENGKKYSSSFELWKVKRQ